MYLRKRGNRWYYTIEERDKNGIRHRHERYGGQTRTEAAKAYRASKVEQDRTGQYFAPSTKKFGDYLYEWLEGEVIPGGKYNTISTYESIIRTHLIPEFGNVKLCNLTTPMLQDYITSLRDSLGRSSLSSILVVLKTSLRWAVANRCYLLVNPADNVRLPRCELRPVASKIFTPDQIAAIFDRYPQGHPLHMPLMLSYCTGMRLGECLALEWKSVDMSKRLIHIVGTSIDKCDNPIVAPPKTLASIRVVTFGQRLCQAFKNQKLWQSENRFHCGPYYVADSEHDFICTTEIGKQLTSNNIKTFNVWAKKQFGLSFHSLRHTHASMLLEHGLPLDYVSKRLGHASVYTTANIYDTITDKREQEATSIMDAFL